MKKILLFVSALALSVSVFGADRLCGEEKKSTIGWDGNYTISVFKAGDDTTKIEVKVASTEEITGFYQFIMQNLGGGTASKTTWDPNDEDFNNPDMFEVASDKKSAVVKFLWDTYPTDGIQFHIVVRRNNDAAHGAGSDIFGNDFTNIDASADCSGGCELTEKPTMSSASLVGEAGFASATLSVAGVDEKSGAITKFIVKGDNYSEQQFDAVDGQIVVTGLSSDTEYSLDVYAKDKCNNVSDNSINVEFTTAEATAECSGQRGHFGTPDQKKINFEIVSDSPSVGQATVTISPIDAADPLDYAEIQMNPGGSYVMDMATGGASASYTFDDTDDSKAIRFLYSLESLPGNDMTCDPLTASAANVIIYTKGGCKGTAVDEAKAAELTMFPNPTTQYVNIAAAEVITNLIVRAQNGAVVAEVAPNDTFYNLDVTGFSTGRYFATIYFGQRFETQTILVK